MSKRRPKHSPLAKWAGAASKVRLTLPAGTACELGFLLEDVVNTGTTSLSSAPEVAKRAAQMLASETLAKPALLHRLPGQELRHTVPQSLALALLAWMLSSPRTENPTSRLRPLLDTLHQLLS